MLNNNNKTKIGDDEKSVNTLVGGGDSPTLKQDESQN